MKMINETIGSRDENLVIIRLNNDDYIEKLKSIMAAPSSDQITELKREGEYLASLTNSGAYGAVTPDYDRETQRIAAAWYEFCERFAL